MGANDGLERKEGERGSKRGEVRWNESEGQKKE